MSDRHNAKQALKTWLTKNARSAVRIDDDTPLLEQRLITSLQVVELVLLIEELSGLPIDAALLEPGSFRDVNTICARFFQATRQAQI